MVAPKQVGTGRVGQKTQLSQREQVRLQKQEDILKQLGLTDPNQLGGNAQQTLDEILAKATVGQVDAKEAAGKIKNAIGRDYARSKAPTSSPGQKLQLPSKGDIPVAKENGDGTFKFIGTGSGSDSPIPDLMSSLGIDPHNMTPSVKNVLEGARGRELSDPKTWRIFSSNLARAKVRDTPLNQTGALTGVKAQTSQAASTVDAVTAKGADLGLKKTARTEAQQKEVDSAATPDAVMNNQAIRDPGAAGDRGKAVEQLQTVLQQAGLTKEQAQELQPFLDKALKSGESKAKTEAEKSWAIVRSASKEATGGKSMPRDKGKMPTGKDAEHATSFIAAQQLMNLAEAKTGAKLEPSKVADMQSIVRGYSKARAAKSVSKSKAGDGSSQVNFGRRQTTEGKQKNGKAGPAYKEAAHEACRSLGLDPEDTTVSHTVKDVERAFNKVMNGAKDDADIALRGLAYVERQTGDKSGALSKHAKMILDNAPEGSDVPQLMKEFAMQKVALCEAVGPENYKAHVAAQMAGGGGRPPGGFFPGMPGGAGGPGAPAMPYGVGEQAFLNEGRFMMGNAILWDPALSHEDKIALFLMFMMSCQDQDRMRKMQELTDLAAKDGLKKDAADANLTAQVEKNLEKMGVKKQEEAGAADKKKGAGKTKQNGAATEPQNGVAAEKQKANVGSSEAEVNTTATDASESASQVANEASTSGTAPPKKPPKNGATTSAEDGGNESGPPNGEPQSTRPGVDPRLAAVADAQQQLQDQNNPEGTKSQEILFSELEKMDKSRDILMQSLMEIIKKKDQVVRDIMRGY